MKLNSPFLLVEINKSEFIFLVCDYVDDNFNIIKKNIFPIQGVYKNKITDYETVLKIFKKNIFQIEQNLNLVFKEVIIILDNFESSIINFSGYKKLNGSQLVKENITYLLNSLKSIVNETETNKKILHIFNTKYLLDKKKFDNLPLGLFGDFYSQELSFFLINKNDYKNLESIFSKCNLKINKIISKNFIDGANLVNKNNFETFLKVEINIFESKIIFFENSALKFVQDFDFGSELVLLDISKIIGLKVETIKEILINEDYKEEDSKDALLEKKYFGENNYRKVKKNLLYEIAIARIKEFSEVLIKNNKDISSMTSKKIPVFLKINDKINMSKFFNDYKIHFSGASNNELNFQENDVPEDFYDCACRIVQYGWKKEAIPIIHEKKSLITRFFNLLFD